MKFGLWFGDRDTKKWSSPFSCGKRQQQLNNSESVAAKENKGATPFWCPRALQIQQTEACDLHTTFSSGTSKSCLANSSRVSRGGSHGDAKVPDLPDSSLPRCYPRGDTHFPYLHLACAHARRRASRAGGAVIVRCAPRTCGCNSSMGGAAVR